MSLVANADASAIAMANSTATVGANANIVANAATKAIIKTFVFQKYEKPHARFPTMMRVLLPMPIFMLVLLLIINLMRVLILFLKFNNFFKVGKIKKYMKMQILIMVFILTLTSFLVV